MAAKNPQNPAPAPKLVNMMDILHERLESLADQAKVIENVAASEGKRSLTDGEVKEIQRIRDEFKATELEIEAREASASMEAALAQPNRRIVPPADLEEAPQDERRPRISVGDRVGVQKGGWGFRSVGEFAIGVAATFRGRPDMRVVNAPSTYGQEAIGADGGYAVPPDFRAEIMKQILGEESLLSRCDQQLTQSNSLVLPLDTATPWATSGGVQTAWADEGQGLTLSKPALGQLECKANKLTALVALTDELLEDSPAMTRWLQSKVPDKFTSALNAVIVGGTGVGQPRGLLNEACKITAGAVSGQGANTIVAKNVSAMWTRLYGRLRNNAVWLINQDVEPQLQALVVPGTSPAFPAYLPPGGFSASPYATLFGRPILPIEACSTLGTEGDIILTDLSQYLTVMKAGGMKSDVSMHLFFDTGHTAFRFVMRVGGQSYWPAAAARAHGSNTLSPIITLNSTRT